MTSSSPSLDIFKPDGEPEEEHVFLEGNLTSSGDGPSGSGTPGVAFNTLDEPIKDTIMRDLKAVGAKFKHVLYPVEKKSLLREWDLWGPLLLCTYMATILQSHVESPQTESAFEDGKGGLEFAEVFVLVWLGAVLVTLNTKLLGGHISFFQCVCVLGYCLLPLGIALTICRVVVAAGGSANMVLFLIRCLSTLLGFVWAVYAAMNFLGECQPEKRKALATYPIGLFYFVLSWIVISHN